ncbi:spermatogenesis-associated protein 17-like isoform X2 [Plodia interpunctella]|uniref:spermatogenesis-associated protein 17-like isoform X2 n=1 Tax=Plodia interpunctella TaxID=58824 RepID=UPI00236842E1|nr:spermatogenesis-associated protein 17-like isoform X2 [Plodia interpunctella]
MASVHLFLPTPREFYAELQERNDTAESCRHERHLAAIESQRIIRGFLARKYIKRLSEEATKIQSAYRMHKSQKFYRLNLGQAQRNKEVKYYNESAAKIQALWRGHYSRRTKFCYRSYRRWLATVTERGERKAAEAAEFGIRSRADDLMILEEEARKWLAFVVFKLHHLLRTHVCAGVYSDPATSELSEFEKLLKSIHYLEYRKRLLRKYEEFVRKHRPRFSNKRLFPIIGNGEDYWYLSLPEMYELTSTVPKQTDTRHRDTHHGPQHKRPFLWKKFRPPSPDKGRGPFSPRSSINYTPPPPAPTPAAGGAGDFKQHQDPRFHLYVKHYTPQPALLDYVDFHINVLLSRKCSIENIDKAE